MGDTKPADIGSTALRFDRLEIFILIDSILYPGPIGGCMTACHPSTWGLVGYSLVELLSRCEGAVEVVGEAA